MGIKEDLQELSPSKSLMIGILVAVVYYFLVFDKGEVVTAQIQTVQVDIDDKNRRLSEVQKAISNKVAFEREAQSLTKDLEELQKFFPVNLSINDVQKEITNILQKTDTKVLTFSEEKITNRFPGYAENGVNVECLGSFHDIMTFLSEVTKMDKVVDFKTMDFASDGSTDEASTVKSKIKLSVFSKDVNAAKESEAR